VRSILDAGRRQAIAVGAGLFTLALVGTYQLGATAATVPGGVGGVATAGAAQQLTVSSAVVPVPAERDAYEVVDFSEVQWPANPGSFSGGWGPRSCAGCSSFHMGIALNAGNGPPVASIAAGVVDSIDAIDGSLGHHVVIRHDVDGDIVYAVYSHLQYGSSPLSVGQKVARGDLVGLIGATGQATAPHLHFALMRQPIGAFFDPMPWMRAHVNIPWGS